MRVTANGLHVTDAIIRLPRLGVWQSDVTVDTEDTKAFEKAVEIDIGPGTLKLKGTAARRGVWRGRTKLRVVAGGAGLATVLPARGYRDTPARLPIGELLTAAGEALSSTADAIALGTVLKQWVRIEGSAGAHLQSLCDKVGAIWRALPDGTVWIGTETWPSSGLTAPRDYQVMDRRPHELWMLLGVEEPKLFPGMTIADGKIDRVVHRIHSHQIRTEVWLG